MDDDEEMKNQCFGGEYLGEIFDHMLKRLNFFHFYFGCILVWFCFSAVDIIQFSS